jgi:hypothetical protein
MKMNETNLRKSLCQAFCKYYKPVKREELACMGFLVIEKLMRKGKEIPFDVFKEKMHLSTEEMLTEELCVLCPFYEEDCDFVQHRELPPCGGFLLLGHLFDTKVISIDNIRDVR